MALRRFRVLCRTDNAALLHDIAGSSDSLPCPVANLVPESGTLSVSTKIAPSRRKSRRMVCQFGQREADLRSLHQKPNGLRTDAPHSCAEAARARDWANAFAHALRALLRLLTLTSLDDSQTMLTRPAHPGRHGVRTCQLAEPEAVPVPA